MEIKMSHGNIQIKNFIGEINKGDYVIPHFQRDFDWRPNMVSELFASILNGYYAGTILLWALDDNERGLKMWDALWGAEKSEKPTKAVLDGQQRLSSIYYSICAPNRTFPNRDSYYYFFINLDQTFIGNEDDSIEYCYYTSYKNIEFFKEKLDSFLTDGWFPLCLLSDEKFLSSTEYQDWLNKYVESRKSKEGFDMTALGVSKKIESILSYPFLTETLEKKNVNEICTIFARINSKGLKLGIFDLMNAFLYPKEIHLKKDWEELDNTTLKDVDAQMKVYILKLISLYKQRYCSSKYLYNLIPGSKIKDKQGNESVLVTDSKEFKQLWTDSIKYSEKARKKIMSNGTSDFGAIKNTYIPNTTIIPVLGALLLKYDKELRDSISENEFWKKTRQWYWCAVISGDYSGSSDSIMSKDYRDMCVWLTDDSKVPERVKKINSAFIEDALDLKRIRNTNSSQYSTILNLLALRSSKDFFTGRILGNYPTSEINDHHMFPVKCGLKLPEGLVDSILNRALLTKETNNLIRNNNPRDYYVEICQKIGSEKAVEELMATHLISTRALKCLKENEFEEFLKERSITIKKELKKLIGITKTEEDVSEIVPGEYYDNENKYISYIEDSEEYICIIDPFFRENTLRLIRKGLLNNDTLKSIKIISKPDTLDTEFRDSLKKFSKQMNESGVSVEMRVLIDPAVQKIVHHRYLITKNKSYNFVSADTVSRGQISHINEVKDMTPRFDDLWNKGKELFSSWDLVIHAKKEKKKRINEQLHDSV